MLPDFRPIRPYTPASSAWPYGDEEDDPLSPLMTAPGPVDLRIGPPGLEEGPPLPPPGPGPLNYFNLPAPAERQPPIDLFGLGSTPPRLPHAPIVPPPPDKTPSLSSYVTALGAGSMGAPQEPTGDPEADKDAELAEALMAEDPGPDLETAPYFDVEPAREQYDRSEDRLGKMMFARTLAENLDLAGRGLTGAAGHLRQEEIPSVNLRGLDYEIGKEDEKMTGGERRLLSGAFGADIPAGESFDRMRTVLPPLADLERGRLAAEAAASRQKEQREINDAREASKNSRFEQSRQDRLAQQEKTRSILNPKQLDDIYTLDSAASILDRIEEEKPKFDTGPAAGRWHSAMNAVGMGDAEKAAFKAMVTTQFNATLRQLTGQAVSPGEAQRVMQEMPTMNDNDDVFMAKLQKTRIRLNELRSIKLQNLERAGKDVSEFQTPARAQPMTGTAPGAATKIMIGGVEYQGTPEQIKAYQDAMGAK